MNLLDHLKTGIILFIISGFFIPLSLEAQQDTIYYTISWRTTIKDSAAFFRPPIKKEGDLFRVEDYYISGQKQMSGLSQYENKDYWVEKVSWYTEDGKLYQQGQYKNNRLDGAFTTFLGDKKLIAIYKNGYIKSGIQNITRFSSAIYTEIKNDTIKEVVYDDDISGIRYENYSTVKSGRYLSKYYDEKGSEIGTIKTLKNGSLKGTEVFYYFEPMRVKQISYYPYDRLLGSTDYYPNGQLRTLFQTGSEYKKTFFNEDGTILGSVIYELQDDYLKPIKGTEFIFSYGYEKEDFNQVLSTRIYNNRQLEREEQRYDDGKVKSITSYKDNIKILQVSFDETGKELARMAYKNYYPFSGVEIKGGRKSTYKEGELVEELKYYPDTNLVFSKKNKEEELYYNKEGVVMGTLKVEYKNKYAKPIEGKRYDIGYNSDINGIETYKNRELIARTNFITKSIAKDSLVDFKNTSYYKDGSYSKYREVFYYSNGSKQSDIIFEDYEKKLGKFYNDKGELIGTYDYLKKDGALYEFFNTSNEVRLFKKENNGVLQTSKRYDYGLNTSYGAINPVLIEETDISCCAMSYDKYGEVIARVNFKNKLPWKGTMYDAVSRIKYEINEGKRNGFYKKFNYNHDIILEEGQYVNDKKEGTFSAFNRLGQLQFTKNYENDILEGKSINYDENGKETSRIIYKNGEPFEGTKVLSSSYSSAPSQEIYKNGLLVKRISYTEEGKNISTFKDGAIAQTIAYYKDSDLKRLQYALNKNYVDGEVIRYDKKGKEQHRGIIKNYKLESGTVYLSAYSLYDNRVAYIILKRTNDMVQLTLVGHKDETLFYVEENIDEGYGLKYIDRLNIYINNLRPESLY
ncbi:toxin-antitoxin system YwqK family antitoxin [Winogradskyella wichelsiae]|uniref:toxin-antitoxin system YwqK family antitoxin n=1 Tax=Winogradskyella wichelsiae TaxID=2697007 RepID=UPI003EF2C057